MTATPEGAGAARVRPVFPVSLRVEGVPCLVVGDGRAAERRARELADAGAAVTVVAPAPCDELSALLAQRQALRHLARRFQPADCAGQRYVFAAIGGEEDVAVARDARAAGAVVHVEDDPTRSDFYLPAVHRSGPVTVAVSTGGASPALASWLRTRLADAVGPEIGELALALASCREALRASGRSTEGLDWASLLDGDVLELLRAGEREAVAARLRTWTEGAS